MDRVFLDANILFSAAYRPNAGFLKLWKIKVQLITSAYAIKEAWINLDTEAQRERLDRLIKNVEVISTSISHELPAGITLPDKDRPILLAAIEAKATHLLTGDITHFGIYYGKTISGVQVLPPSDYL